MTKDAPQTPNVTLAIEREPMLMRAHKRYISTSAWFVYALAMPAACSDTGGEPCSGGDGLVYDRESLEVVKQKAHWESVRVCWRGQSDGAIVFDGVQSIDYLQLSTENEQVISFPSLVEVGALVLLSGSPLELPALEVADTILVDGAYNTSMQLDALRTVGDLYIHGGNIEFFARALTDANFLQMELDDSIFDVPLLRNLHGDANIRGDNAFGGGLPFETVEILSFFEFNAQQVALPNLKEASILSVSTSPAVLEIEAPVLSRATELSLSGNQNLNALAFPELNSLGRLRATDNPKLKNCSLEALALQAGVPSAELQLDGNSSDSCP